MSELRRRVPTVAVSGIALILAALLPAALLYTSASPALAQRQVPASRGEVQQSFAPIVKATAPAVVNVYVTSRVQAVETPFDDPFFRRFFGDRFGMPRDRVQNSLGSGVIVSADGLVVTNTHVVGTVGAAEIRVVLADKRELAAKIVAQDAASDIAVLRIEGNGRFPFLELANSDELEVGDLVLAIGNPFGVGQTVTSGIVSALARSEVGRSESSVFIQTDAAINPGNSGGALVDMSGRLAGINTAIFSRTGASHGIGFAIPANLVRLHVESARRGRPVERPWLAAKLEPVTRDIAQSLGLERVAGALVASVSRRGPAATAGLKLGDIIVGVDGTEVADARAVLYRLTTRGVGNRADIEVLRGGRRVRLALAIEAAPKPGRDDVRLLDGNQPLAGAEVANLVPAIAEQLGLEEAAGVVVTKVTPGSIAQSLGFQPSDVVLAVGERQIESLTDLAAVLARPTRLWQLSVRRGTRVLQLQVPG